MTADRRPGYTRRMVHPIAVAALLTAFLVSAATAARAQCPLEPGSVETAVVKKPVSIVYHHDMNGREITHLAGVVPPMGSYHNAGFTASNVNYNLTVEGTTAPAGGPWYCAVLTKAIITLSIPNLDVYVTRDYRKDSCLYTAVLTHELKHVGNLRDTLEDLIERWKQELRASSTIAGTTNGHTRQEALNALKDKLQARLKPLFFAWKVELEQRDAALDERESRINEDQLCPSLRKGPGAVQSSQ